MTESHDDLTSREAAVELVLDRRETVLDGHDTTTVGVDDITHRVLAEPIVAQRDVPPADIATMDGFAIDAEAGYPLRLRDEEVTAEVNPPTIEPDEAVPIATGARLPDAANAVLKVEDATVSNGRLEGPELEVGTYTYERGSNVTAGETLFHRGEVLSPKDAIFLRDLGHEQVAVTRRFTAGVLATGTEIHEGQWDDLDTPMLVGLVRSWGHEATAAGTVPDDRTRVIEAIADLASEHDVVITTGGTSVGSRDYVIDALDALGEVVFHRVSVRPGKPIAMAVLPDHDATAFAIPGKPVGAHTIATLVMGPFFTGSRALPTIEAQWPVDLALGDPDFEYCIPVVLDGDTAVPLGHRSSALSVYDETYDPSVLSSTTRATRADGFVVTTEPLSADSTVEVVPYPVVE